MEKVAGTEKLRSVKFLYSKCNGYARLLRHFFLPVRCLVLASDESVRKLDKAHNLRDSSGSSPTGTYRETPAYEAIP